MSSIVVKARVRANVFRLSSARSELDCKTVDCKATRASVCFQEQPVLIFVMVAVRKADRNGGWNHEFADAWLW